VIILGDLNGHISEKDGGIKGAHKKTNINGHRIVNLVKRFKMKIMNTDCRCEGKWTWMRRDQRSVIDYVISGELGKKNITKIIIDETGENGM
jgi:hypothetical protein